MRSSGWVFLSALVVLAVVFSSVPATAASFPEGWSRPVQVSDESATTLLTTPYSVAVTSSGRALVAVQTFDDQASFYEVQTRIIEPGAGWGPVESVGIFLRTQHQIQPHVAAFPDGSFVMEYEVRLASTSRLYTQLWTVENGWGLPQRITAGTDPVSVSTPAVATDAQGNAFVVWQNYDGAHLDLMASRYTPTTGWSTLEAIDGGDGTAFSPSIATDQDGNAVCVFGQVDGSGIQRAWANRYTVGAGWGTALTIDAGPRDINTLDVATGPSGKAVAIMDQYNGSARRVYANVFTPGEGWATAVPIDASVGSLDNLKVVGSPDGSYTAVWTQYGGTMYDLATATYSAAGTWSAPVNLTAGVGKGSRSPSLAVDGSGALHLLFLQYGDNSYAHVALLERTPSGTWGSQFNVSSNQYGYPTQASCASDRCAALFSQYAGQDMATVVSLFETPDTTAPALDLSAPADGSSTANATAVVSGTTEPGATLVVNGVQAHVTDAGAFSLTVALLPGANTIDVSATDAAGNVATASATVTYDDPVPGLETDLQAADAQIQQLGQSLDDARAALNGTQAELTQAEADLAAAKANLSSAQADLATAQEQIAAQQALDATHTTDISAANGSAGTALLVGSLGLVVGLAAVGLAFMRGRAARGGTRPAEERPPEEPPKSG